MRQSKIQSSDYLGPYDAVLAVGDVQNMNYTDTDLGPFYLAVEEREHDWWNDSGIKLRSEIGAGEESLHECYKVIYIYLSVLVCVKEWGFLNNSIDPSPIAYGC